MGLSLLMPPSIGRPKASARAELLEQALSQELGRPVRVELAPTYRELERRTLAGEAHIVWAPAAICARIEPSAHAMFKVVRHGRSTYCSAIVALRGAGVSLLHPKGLRAAWVDELSLGGYLLAADHLARRGVDLDASFSKQVFHGSHPAALGAVLHGTADLTAVTVSRDDETLIRGALAMHAGPRSQALTILAVTREVPCDALVFTHTLDREAASAIVDALFSPRRPRPPSFLFAALEAEGFERAAPDEYRPLLSLLRA